MSTVRLATRTSDLALTQARLVAGMLEARLGVATELVRLQTTGDRIQSVSLAKLGGKGLFVKEIEEALLEHRADLAVHSAKDLPAALPEGLELVAFPERADPRDALVARERGATLESLPRGARVGTGSVRRMAQLRALRPDLEVVPLRGNVPTRLRKLESENLDAVILACAGLERLGLADRIDERLAPEAMLPAVTQGILAIEGRAGDAIARAAAALASIIETRTTEGAFTSLQDFVNRIDVRLCNKRVLESLISAGACDTLGGHRAQLLAASENALAEAQLLQQEREAGQASLFGDGREPAAPARQAMPDIPDWEEAERLAKEKEVLGFFISGHPLENFRHEVELFGTRTTATLGQWSEHEVTISAIVTTVKRQISKKTGKEYARLTLEDFHGTAQAIVFPDSWAKLNQIVTQDAAMLLTGGYSMRDRGEENAPFVVESAQPLEALRASGAVGVTVRWRAPEAPQPEVVRKAAALLAAHPGPAPVYIEWSDGNGESLRLRSRRLRVAPNEELVHALRDLFGVEAVHIVKAD